jgi:hypothetical protein
MRLKVVVQELKLGNRLVFPAARTVISVERNWTWEQVWFKVFKRYTEDYLNEEQAEYV